jgi:hypothetical protein
MNEQGKASAEYEQYIKSKSYAELLDIENNINREKYPEKYAILQDEIQKRSGEESKTIGGFFTNISSMSKADKICRICEIPAFNIALPLALCIIFKFFPLGSIGPLVLFYFLAAVFVTPFLLFRLIGSFVNNTSASKRSSESTCDIFSVFFVLFIGSSLIVGVFLGVLSGNLFIWLTAVFGIMDYQLM